MNAVGDKLGINIYARYDDAQERWQLRLEKMLHGNLKVSVIDDDLLVSGDYAQLRKTAEILAGLFGPGGIVLLFPCFFSRVSQPALKHLTATADLHFFIEGFVHFALTGRSTDEPAHLARIELKDRAFFLSLFRTVHHGPAGARVTSGFTYQKIDLSLHMVRDGPPALFVTVNRLDGHAEKNGHVFLGSVQSFSDFGKLPGFHRHSNTLRSLTHA